MTDGKAKRSRSQLMVGSIINRRSVLDELCIEHFQFSCSSPTVFRILRPVDR